MCNFPVGWGWVKFQAHGLDLGLYMPQLTKYIVEFLQRDIFANLDLKEVPWFFIFLSPMLQTQLSHAH